MSLLWIVGQSIFVALLVCEASASGEPGLEESQARAIVKGYDAPDRPFYVQLHPSGLICGGTIISTRRVATAAHCVTTPTFYITIRDFSDPRSRGYTLNVRARIHPSFNANYYSGNDVAFLDLDRDVEPWRVMPICRSNYGKTSVYVAGMGRMSGGYFPRVLQEVELTETHSDCDFHIDPRTQICAKGKSKRDSCGGDSGGPMFLMVTGGIPKCLYGIVSYGSPDCSGMGVYTRASYYYNWLLQ